MAEICEQIPKNLDGVDFEHTGYHRGCYQNFTKNQDRLTLSAASEGSSSRTPRKRTSSTSQLFPQVCIFCQQLEIKVSGKTERCTMFGEKVGALNKPSWHTIEQRALELGISRLHRMVQGEDLFGKKAHYHSSCKKEFDSKYFRHNRQTAQSTKPATESDTRLLHIMKHSVV